MRISRRRCVKGGAGSAHVVEFVVSGVFFRFSISNYTPDFGIASQDLPLSEHGPEDFQSRPQILAVLKTLRKFRDGHIEADGENLKRTERGVFLPSLYVANVGPAQASVLGKVVLIPASGLSEFPNALSKPGANIRTCHQFSMDVSFWLYFADWLHFGEKGTCVKHS